MGFQLLSKDSSKPVEKALSNALKDPGLVCIGGPSGSGKSWVLQKARTVLPDLDVIQLFVPMARAHQSAVEQLAGALRQRGDQSVLVVDDRAASWDAKLDAVFKPLVAMNGRALLLIDNADRIDTPGPAEIVEDTIPEGSVASRRRLVDALVALSESVRIVVTASNVSSQVGARSTQRLRVSGTGHVSPEELNIALPARAKDWSVLVEMCGYRPLWIRLAAGLLHAGLSLTQVAGFISRANQESTPDPLIDAALGQVRGQDDLWNTLVVFAAAEEVLPLKEAIELAGIDRKAVTRLRELGLVDSIIPKHVRVHEDIRERLKECGGVARTRVHQTLGRRAEKLYRAEPFEGFTEAGLRHRRAAADHYIEAGLIDETRRVSGGFVGPILDLGRRLGIRGRETEHSDAKKAVDFYKGSVGAYGAAISFGGRLPYAIHYRAWNQYRGFKVGGAPIEIVDLISDLREAAIAASSQPWYWRRLALVLLDHGRQDEAIEAVKEGVSRVAPERCRDELAAPVVSALRQRRQIRAARMLADLVIDRCPGAGIALDTELALLLRLEGKRPEATRYFAGRLRLLAEIPDALRATLVTWLEEDGQVAEARSWKQDQTAEIARTATEPEPQPVSQVPPLASAGTKWVLIRDGSVFREANDPVALTEGIPQGERHRYLAVLREEIRPEGAAKS